MRKPAPFPLALTALLLSVSLRAAAADVAPTPAGFAPIIAAAIKARFDTPETIPAGFVATIQKEGIGAITHGEFANIYAGGLIRHANDGPARVFYNATRRGRQAFYFTSAGVVHNLERNEKVYISGVDFVKGSAVVVHFVTCGDCDLDVVDPDEFPSLPGASFPLILQPLPCILLQLPAHATFTFQFGRPYLSSATPLQIEQMINSIFAPVPDEEDVSGSVGALPNGLPPTNFE